MRLIHAAATHQGLVRENNQDAYFANDDAGLYAVADGMGGHAAGEVASDIAIRQMRLLSETPFKLRSGARVEKAFAAAHDAILARAREYPDERGMGTTCVAFLYAGAGTALIGHVGDSRIYRLRDGTCEQLTKDHAGWRGALLNCLGDRRESHTHTDVIDVELVAPGDVYVLCSDGLTRYLDGEAIGKIVTDTVKRDTKAGTAAALVRAALTAGGGDNITVIVVGVLP